MALITKGVSLAMVDYAENPTFTDADILGDLTSFPSITGTPSALDCTTLADAFRHYVNGIRDNGGSLEFGFLYSAGLLNKLNTAANPSGNPVHKSFQLKFPDGVTLTFGGYVAPAIDGHGVDEVLTLTAVVTMDTDIDIDIPA